MAGLMVFFLRRDSSMQFIAGEDIGNVVARIFVDPSAHAGATIELAGDELTGSQLAEKNSRATGTRVTYAQFPPEVLAQNPLLRRIVEIVDRRR